MNYSASPLAITIFICFIIFILGLSFYFGHRTKTSSTYYAAGGNINWGINGIAFAGDYLSAASFLGICGMVAAFGYDGFLYAIGFLAGWMVALFIVAEPIKKLGKYTFTDALDSKFRCKGIKLLGAVSTLLVSVVYLIPQMVGAGTLVTPLFGLSYEFGVVLVGLIVIIIVATAGMTSTTYVQFIKGGLLIVFSLLLVILVLTRGIGTSYEGNTAQHELQSLKIVSTAGENIVLQDSTYQIRKVLANEPLKFVELSKDNVTSIWTLDSKNNVLRETQTVTRLADGTTLYNGEVKASNKFYQVGHLNGVDGEPTPQISNLGLFSFIEKIKNGEVVRWSSKVIEDGGRKITVYYQNPTAGIDILSPGLKYKIDSEKGAKATDKINFISLMLALFFGAAALPHILIRYYTVPNAACARKSTIVAIVAMGLFYMLTLYLGLGAMTGGVLDVTNSNMAVPLLAKSFGIAIFACICAIAFATVLGTVSGLLVASSGAIVHDLLDQFFHIKLSDRKKIAAGKLAAIIVGCIAIGLGLLFKNMNVASLVGWAFAVAAAANFPAIIMILFWKKTTARGVIWSILIGLLSSLTIILLSQEAYDYVYQLTNATAPFAFSNPAIICVPLSFLTLITVSLLERKKVTAEQSRGVAAWESTVGK